MKRTSKIIAFALAMCLSFCAFTSIGFAEDVTPVDPAIYNDNSMVFCYAMKVLTSKTYGEIIEKTDDLKPLWLLAREIAISKEYNESYKNTADGIEILGSESYAIKNIKAAIKTDFTENVTQMYLDIFSGENTSDEILSKCLAIEAYLKYYSDLIVINDEVNAVIKFYTTTVDKFKKDMASYNAVFESNLESFTSVANELKNADRDTLLERYDELNTLYLSTLMGLGASESTLELYGEITLRYRICAAANECMRGLVILTEGFKITPAELYDNLCGINYFIEYADTDDAQVSAAEGIYRQKLSLYNRKYVSHNETITELNEFAGSICVLNSGSNKKD